MATSDILFYHKHKHTHTWLAHTNACLYTHPKQEKAPLLNTVKFLWQNCPNACCFLTKAKRNITRLVKKSHTQRLATHC